MQIFFYNLSSNYQNDDNVYNLEQKQLEYKDKPDEEIKKRFDSIYKNWIWGGDNKEPEAGGGGSGGG